MNVEFNKENIQMFYPRFIEWDALVCHKIGKPQSLKANKIKLFNISRDVLESFERCYLFQLIIYANFDCVRSVLTVDVLPSGDGVVRGSPSLQHDRVA